MQCVIHIIPIHIIIMTESDSTVKVESYYLLILRLMTYRHKINDYRRSMH